jgi:hypothetical protein
LFIGQKQQAVAPDSRRMATVSHAALLFRFGVSLCQPC